MLEPLLFVIVAVLVVFLVLFWVIALIKKVGGCLIHLMLLGAGLILFLYLGWLFFHKLLPG